MIHSIQMICRWEPGHSTGSGGPRRGLVSISTTLIFVTSALQKMLSWSCYVDGSAALRRANLESFGFVELSGVSE